jgi:hypothetical protein
MEGASMTRKLFWRIVLAACLFFGLAEASVAVTFNVNSTADQIDDDVTDGVCHTAANTCTLRAAIMQANHEGGLASVINLPAGTYFITRPILGADGEDEGDLNIAANETVTIVGAGAATTIIDGNAIDTVLNVSGTLYLSGVTLQHGAATEGGALANEEVVSLSDCVLTNNSAISAGAIYNRGTMTIARSVISFSQSQSLGAIWTLQGSVLSIVDSTITDNTASASDSSGGGISIATYATVTLVGSTVSNNTAAFGGGISTSGNLIALNTTLANNEATDSGGGIYFSHTDSAMQANLYNTTIAYNDARDGVGGGFRVEPNATFNIYNSLTAHNTRADSPEPDDCSGAIFSHANNLFGATSDCSITKINSSQYGLLNSIDLLGPLVNNGGRTQTIAILDGSNAIDGGPSVGCFDRNSQIITEDQRGFPRPLGAHCDIGAFESGDAVFRNGFE